MSLLIDENPLYVSPTLAKVLGLNEAMILQKLNELMYTGDNIVICSGRRWIKCTLTEWGKHLPFLSETTIKRAFHHLRDIEIVDVGRFDAPELDRTNYYTIDFEKLDYIVEVLKR